MSQFLQLPGEVLINILRHCEENDIECFSATCRALRREISWPLRFDGEEFEQRATKLSPWVQQLWKLFARRRGWFLDFNARTLGESGKSIDDPYPSFGNCASLMLERLRSQQQIAMMWRRILVQYGTPAFVSSLCQGSSLADVRNFEALMGARPLSAPFFCSVMSHHDGQKFSTAESRAQIHNLRLLPLSEIIIELGHFPDGYALETFPITDKPGIHQLHMDFFGRVWLSSGWNRSLFASNWLAALDALFPGPPLSIFEG